MIGFVKRLNFSMVMSYASRKAKIEESGAIASRSQPRDQMEMRYWLHVPAALLPKKEHQNPLRRKLGGPRRQPTEICKRHKTK
jgi:hypothetical protein